MKIKIFALATVILLMFAGSVLGQNGLNMNWIGSGTRARAMGGAFVSLADDASAITWNPAGLIQTLDPQISFTMAYAKPKSTFDLTYSHGNGNESFSMDDNVWRISYASFVAPIMIGGHQFSASVAYQTLSEVAYARMIHPSLYVDWDSTVASNLEETSLGHVDVINLGFGTDITECLAFGASANIYIGNTDETTEIYALWYDSLEVYEQKVTLLWRGHFLQEVDYTGFNVTFGLHYKAEKFKLGLTAKTPFKLIRSFDIVKSDTLFQTAADVFIPLSPEPEYYIVNQEERIEIPWTLAAGGSYLLKPNLLVAADVEWRQFGKSDMSILDETVIESSGKEEKYYTDYPLNYLNAGEVRGGFEYTIESEHGIVPIRGGFRYIVQNYLTDQKRLHAEYGRDHGILKVNSSSVAVDDQTVSCLALTGGTGIHWERIWLDAAVEYYTSSRTITGWDRIGSFDGDDKFSQTNLTLNFTGFF